MASDTRPFGLNINNKRKQLCEDQEAEQEETVGVKAQIW